MIKIAYGVYELFSLEKFDLSGTIGDPEDNFKDEIEVIEKWIEKNCSKYSFSGWSHRKLRENDGSLTYHLDGHFLYSDPPQTHLVLCMLSNFPKEGTIINLKNNRKYTTKPWTVYLIDGFMKHKGPWPAHKRTCLRWYVSPKKEVLI